MAADGTVRRWPVPAPFAEPDLARLADRVALMTGQRMDDNQGLDSVPADEWRALRAKLVGDGSTALVPPRPDADWHDAVAADAEQDGDAYGAEWHLDRLATLRPDDWTIPARRGRVLARAGRRDEAAAAYDQAARLARVPRDLADWLRAAAADDEAARRYDRGLWNLDRAVAAHPGRLGAVRGPRRAGGPGRAHRTGPRPTSTRPSASGPRRPRSSRRPNGPSPGRRRPADWTRVAKLLTAAAKDPSLPVDDRYHLAVACLKAGDPAGYRAACAGIVGRMPPAGTPLTTGRRAIAATGAFALGPNATDDWSVPLSWADRVLTPTCRAGGGRPVRERTNQAAPARVPAHRGALLVRAGRSRKRRRRSGRGWCPPAGGEFQDWLFLALAEHRLGHADAANGAAEEAGGEGGGQARPGLGPGRGRTAGRGAGRALPPLPGQ